MDINKKSLWHNSKFIAETGGYFIRDDLTRRVITSFEAWDTTRRDMLILLLRALVENNVSGELAEVGVYKGATARLVHHYMSERQLYLFDTFEGFTLRGAEEERIAIGNAVSASHFSDTSLENVKKFIAPINDNVHFIKGYFPDTVTEELNGKTFAFVHLDADLYEVTMAGLKFFYPRMAHHGVIVIHDFNAWLGARRAVENFMRDKSEFTVPMADKSGSALIVRSYNSD